MSRRNSFSSTEKFEQAQEQPDASIRRFSLKDTGLRTPNIDRIFNQLALSNFTTDEKPGLVSNVGAIDYTTGHNGEMPISTIPSQHMFVDDIFVFAYVGETDLEHQTRGGKLQLIQGENSVAKRLVQAVQRETGVFRAEKYSEVRILTTCAIYGTEGKTAGSIAETVAQIDENAGGMYRAKFVKHNTCEPKAIVHLKFDTSNIPAENVTRYLPLFVKNLYRRGFGLYSLDVTHDHAGTLSYANLCDHFDKLGYGHEASLPIAMKKGVSAILDNTASVGRNVFTYVEYTTIGGLKAFMRVKCYNKLVSQLEAGDVLNPGGHTYEYASKRGSRLAHLFDTPEVRECGVSRLEISIYGVGLHRLVTADEATEISLSNSMRDQLGKVRERLNGCVFYRQPSRNQTQLFLDAHTSTLCLFSQETRKFLIVNAVNGYTKRVANAVVGKIHASCDYDRACHVLMGDFGLRGVPIYSLDVSVEREKTEIEVVTRTNGVYVKPSTATTYLCATKKPNSAVRETDISDAEFRDYIPVASNVEYVLRRRAGGRIGSGSPTQMTQMSQEFLVDLMTRQEVKLKDRETWDAKERLRWEEDRRNVRAMQKEREQPRLAELAKQISEAAETLTQFEARRGVMRENVAHTISEYVRAQRIGNCTPGHYMLVAFRQSVSTSTTWETNTSQPLVSCMLYPCAPDGTCVAMREQKQVGELYWANKSLRDTVNSHEQSAEKLRVGRCEGWAYFCDIPHIVIGVEKTFVNREGTTITYTPTTYIRTHIGAADTTLVYEQLNEKIAEHQYHIDELNAQKDNIQHIPYTDDLRKRLVKCGDMDEGEYTTKRYMTQMFRGSIRYLLETPCAIQGTKYIHGYFITQRMTALLETHNGTLANELAPLTFRLGAMKTTPVKSKARVCDIVV